jgi:hypothetical protein
MAYPVEKLWLGAGGASPRNNDSRAAPVSNQSCPQAPARDLFFRAAPARRVFQHSSLGRMATTIWQADEAELPKGQEARDSQRMGGTSPLAAFRHGDDRPGRGSRLDPQCAKRSAWNRQRTTIARGRTSMAFRKVELARPPKPPKPIDRFHLETKRPVGATKWVEGHWLYDYDARKWEWVFGHWSK